MSQWPLNFDKQIDYGRYDEITVEIALTAGDSLAAVDAKLDAGSKFCVSQPRAAPCRRSSAIPRRRHDTGLAHPGRNN
jgi:hypothetical protein